MSSIFPRWTNQIPTAAALAVPVLGLGVAAGVTFFFSPYYTDVGYQPEQPVPYSHELHAGEMGMDCRYCHNTVEYAGYAAVPPTATCLNCHNYVKTNSEKLALVRQSGETGEPIPWMKIHQLPDYAYFNHSVHVTAGVGCVSCHGRIDHMEEVYLHEPLSMGWCIRCHRNPEPNLRDPSEVTNMAWPRTEQEKAYDRSQGPQRSAGEPAAVLLRMPPMTKMPKLTTGPQSPSRRNFLAAMGATVASINAAACIRKPYEKILPFGKRPEDLVPGRPEHYATAFNFGETVQGLLAQSTDGRPTKIEGNPNHPLSMGATNSWAQASVLALYDPDRSQRPVINGKSVDGKALDKKLDSVAKAIGKTNGTGTAVLVDRTPSPTVERLLAELTAAHPGLRLFVNDGADDTNALAGAKMVGLDDMSWTYGGEAQVVASFDADPLLTEGDSLAFTRAYAKRRDPKNPREEALRLYVAEPGLSLTGVNADHRRAVKSAAVAELMVAVSQRLRRAGKSVPELPVSAELLDDPFVVAVADDLAARAAGKTLVLVGERQPAQVHALGFLINQALGNFGSTIAFHPRKRPNAAPLSEMVGAVEAGKLKRLIVLGGNPVDDAPEAPKVRAALSKLEQIVHLGSYRDETGVMAHVHVPASHYLEAWGDLVARDGTVSVQQPLIAPLYDSTMSVVELLAKLLGRGESGFDLVRETHKDRVTESFDKAWQKWLHDGVVARGEAAAVSALASNFASGFTTGPAEPGFDVVFARDASVLDGRFGNSPWLQENPDPITKLTWDNAATISPATARKLGVESGGMVAVGHHDASAAFPVWVQAGMADDVVVLPIGYGRAHGGRYAKSGFSVSALRSSWVLTGAAVVRTRGSYELACSQVETSLHDRPLHRETSREAFAEDPDFVGKFEVLPEEHQRTILWDDPFTEQDHRWGMTIDLNSCSGCGTCTVACQAENNIPWVGKEEVLKGREMHWIRIDRYYEGETAEDLEFKIQPLGCQQCETAPCENVCPVAATVHSPEGTNDMVYNRCIGTRYCANNCPYKVRRFNFFHYTVRNDAEYGLGIAMQRNPDVTVRYRGVMEKCSYCAQRMSRARIEAKVYGDGIIPDGAITPACAQACPAEAIVFGNLEDEKSRVAEKASDPRNYAILAELNTRPRTTYLARLTNPNDKMKTNNG